MVVLTVCLNELIAYKVQKCEQFKFKGRTKVCLDCISVLLFSLMNYLWNVIQMVCWHQTK